MLTNSGQKILNILEEKQIDNETKFIIKTELLKLERDSIEIDVLTEKGVANWERYGEAIREYYKRIRG